MAVIVGMGASNKTCGYTHLFSIKPIRKMMDYAQICIKLPLMRGKYLCVIQNVPPPMPFKAVKLVNFPAAGMVRPMVELLIATLSIVPPVMTMVWALKSDHIGIHQPQQPSLCRPARGRVKKRRIRDIDVGVWHGGCH